MVTRAGRATPFVMGFRKQDFSIRKYTERSWTTKFETKGEFHNSYSNVSRACELVTRKIVCNVVVAVSYTQKGIPN